VTPGQVFWFRDDDGYRVEDGHPFVVLFIESGQVHFGNITDVEHERYISCVLYPSDDPRIITKESTFRYRSLRVGALTKLQLAVRTGRIEVYGDLLARNAFEKIIQGAKDSEIVKPDMKKIFLKHYP
jgi:hypothetical protein